MSVWELLPAGYRTASPLDKPKRLYKGCWVGAPLPYPGPKAAAASWQATNACCSVYTAVGTCSQSFAMWIRSRSICGCASIIKRRRHMPASAVRDCNGTTPPTLFTAPAAAAAPFATDKGIFDDALSGCLCPCTEAGMSLHCNWGSFDDLSQARIHVCPCWVVMAC